MPENDIRYLLLDTSYLRDVGFSDPDFRKLLRLSQENKLKIFIPHIVWEERRTQLMEKARDRVRKLRKEFDGLSAELPSNFVLEGLAPPTLNIWTDAEIDARSKDVMAAFALENKVEIVSLAPDHADRAWQRYFNVHPPFNRDEKRENRRKDIPDSWIFETAIDIKSKHPGLLALCGDGRLSDALKAIEVCVFKKTQEVLDEIEESLHPTTEVKTGEIKEPAPREIPPAGAESKLDAALAEARESFKYLDAKVLGYVSYIGSPTKGDLFSLLSRSGTSIEVAKNVTERLVLSGVIIDTGSHYLPGSKEDGELAATMVEAEIIKLLES
jgi:predicted nucleic acid-binding protein